jgi:hypothetical protein
MRFKNLVACFLLSMAMDATCSNANTDYCFNLPGPWDGDAIVSYKVRASTLRCEYSSKVLISRPVSDPYHFTADITFKRVSGVCFPYEHLILPGECDGKTGAISIQSDDVSTSGITDGFTASLQGKVKILANLVTADVEKLELLKR